MKIRAFKRDDTKSVISLWKGCGLIVSWNDPAKDIKRKLDSDPQHFLVGEVEEAIVASVMGGFDGHRGWINYLAVSPEFRGLGYGRDMMNAIEDLLRSVGCPKINLQIRDSNKKAIAFYKAIGFDVDNVLSMGKRLVVDD